MVRVRIAVVGVHDQTFVRFDLELIRDALDAAHAFGAEYGARAVGQFGDAEVFSLTPTKLLVAGEGGLIATNDAVLAGLLKSSRNYGESNRGLRK